VLDLALNRNLSALEGLLNNGVRVRYFDHHLCANIPKHPLLETHINTASDVCTGMLVNAILGGRYKAWAIVCAYGDNLTHSAERMASSAGINSISRETLRMVGEAVNYNAYGESEQDVLLAPAELFSLLLAYPNPLNAAHDLPILRQLTNCRQADLQAARRIAPTKSSPNAAAYLLPDGPWSRRVSGSFANDLATREPTLAHAVLKQRDNGHYLVSVRAPKSQPHGAGERRCCGYRSPARRSVAVIPRSFRQCPLGPG
jgi:hypothetical protein